MSSTVQFPAFRHTVAEQMAGHRERIADRIRVELARRGEQPADLAYRIKVHPRTVENWLSPDPDKATSPQGANLKAVADDFGIAIEELNPDLELVEKAFRDQLERIERKLDAVAEALGINPAEIAAQAAEDAAQETAAKRNASSGTPGAKRKKSGGG